MTATDNNLNESGGKPVLHLKEHHISDPTTEHIFSITRKTIERFNYYVEDFFQTREILLEQSESLRDSDDRAKREENSESLRQVMMRIKEIKNSMSYLVEEMPDLVTIEEE